jgi:hypothetical protein
MTTATQILSALSSKARDGFHKAAVDNLRKLRDFAFSTDGALAHQRLTRAGIPEPDRQALFQMFTGANRPCRMVLLCLDSLAQSAEDIDMERVMKYAAAKLPIVVVLLPGAILRTELVPPRWPIPMVGVVDLREPQLWRQERLSWVLHDERVVGLLQRPIRTILESWRGGQSVARACVVDATC